MNLVGVQVWSVLVCAFKEADVSSALNDGKVDSVSGVVWLVTWHNLVAPPVSIFPTLLSLPTPL